MHMIILDLPYPPSVNLLDNPEVARQIFQYDPDTGNFYWLKKVARKIVVGTRAGSRMPVGYWCVQVFVTRYYLHRLAFAMMGEKVPELVDHINRDRSDNRWVNLRYATKSLNSANIPIRKTNTSGHPNVSYDKTRKKFCVSIKTKDGLCMGGDSKCLTMLCWQRLACASKFTERISMIVIDLPWPPSTNHYWRSPNTGKLAGRTLISKKGRDYRKAVAHAVIAANRPKADPGRLDVGITAFPQINDVVTWTTCPKPSSTHSRTPTSSKTTA